MSTRPLSLERRNEQSSLPRVPETPPVTEGFLFDHHAQVDGLAIEDIKTNVYEENGEHGYGFIDIYYMNNGLHYPVITSIPHQPKTNIPVDMTTAWGTSAKINSHNGRSLGVFVAEGFPSRLFGPPRVNLPKGITRYARVPEAFALAEQTVTMDADVAAYALIAEHSDEMNRWSIEKGISMRYGESRGIMEGLGSVAVDQLYGRKTIWLEGIDPCIPEELELKDLVFCKNSVGELSAAVTTMRKIMTEGRRLKYVDTLDLSLEYLLPAIATRHTLFSGRAGTFGENIPDDTPGRVAFFDSSIANDYEIFMQKLSHAPQLQTDLLRGGHLTLAAREMVYRAAARMVAARDSIEKHGEDFVTYDLGKIQAAQPAHIPKIKPSDLLPLPNAA